MTAAELELIRAARGLAADGRVRTVAGFEAVHYPASRLHCEAVYVREGAQPLRSVKGGSTAGAWSRVERVPSWTGVLDDSRRLA